MAMVRLGLDWKRTAAKDLVCREIEAGNFNDFKVRMKLAILGHHTGDKYELIITGVCKDRGMYSVNSHVRADDTIVIEVRFK